MPEATQNQEQDQGLRTRITDAARALFLDHGYSKVSTSEIAEALGISKKTLYKEFENKEEILRACTLPRMKESAKVIDAIIADEGLAFPDKLQAVMSAIGFQYKRATPILMRDVCVHAPDVWKEIQAFKMKRFKKFGELLEEGIRQGVFRSDIPAEIILRTYTAAAENILNPQSLGELPCSAQEAFQSLVKILFEGIINEDSRADIEVATANHPVVKNSTVAISSHSHVSKTKRTSRA